MENKSGNKSKIRAMLDLFQHLPFSSQIRENTLLITTGKREPLKRVQGGLYCMTTRKAFTLIELLVVVLIIGILAAIAVPQYEKTVERSKATQALTLLRSAYQAAAAYYMANGTYPETFEEMGFEIPWTGTTKWSQLSGVKDTKSNEDWSFQLYHAGAGGLALYAGRISGKYAGAGFTMSTVNDSKQLTSGTLRCAERISFGITFDTNLSAGDYCIKIMNGTLRTDSTATTFRSYSLSK